MLTTIEQLRKELAEANRRAKQLESQVKASAQQMEAMLKKVSDVDAGSKRSKIDIFSEFSLADQQEIFLKLMLANESFMSKVGGDNIVNAWVAGGSGGKTEVLKLLIKDYSKGQDDLIALVSSALGEERLHGILKSEKSFVQKLLDQGNVSAAGDHLKGLIKELSSLPLTGIPDVMVDLVKEKLKEMLTSGQMSLEALLMELGYSIGDIADLLNLRAASQVEGGAKAVGVDAETQYESQDSGHESPSHKASKPLKSKEGGTELKKRKPLYAAPASKQMPYDNVVRLIHEAYEVKILADLSDDSSGRNRQPFVDFMRDFMVRKYGLKSIAMKHVGEIYASVEKNHEKSLTIRAFGHASGMLEPDTWSARVSDFMLAILMKTCEIEGRALSTISEWLNADKEAGVSEDAAIFAASEVSTFKCSFLLVNDATIDAVRALPRNELGQIFVNELLLWACDFLKKSQVQVRNGFMKVFVANDKNGDGVLELYEFTEMIKQIIAPSEEVSERHICELYDEASALDNDGDPDSISKEAFAELCIKHHYTCPAEFLKQEG